jgi:hypothetical protein
MNVFNSHLVKPVLSSMLLRYLFLHLIKLPYLSHPRETLKWRTCLKHLSLCGWAHGGSRG